ASTSAVPATPPRARPAQTPLRARATSASTARAPPRAAARSETTGTDFPIFPIRHGEDGEVGPPNVLMAKMGNSVPDAAIAPGPRRRDCPRRRGQSIEQGAALWVFPLVRRRRAPVEGGAQPVVESSWK